MGRYTLPVQPYDSRVQQQVLRIPLRQNPRAAKRRGQDFERH